MNPNEVPQSSSWWINIDQMLQSLSTTVVAPVVSEKTTNNTPIIEQAPIATQSTPIVEQPIEEQTPTMEQPTTSQTLEPSFSIESLTKPLPSTETPTISQTAPKNLRLSHAAGMMASVVGTLAVIVIGWWVYSVQYPVETKQFMDSISGLFNSTTSTTQKNLEPDTLVVTATGEDGMHSAAPEDSYMLDTPLADALLNSQSWADAPNSTEKMLDNAIGTDNNQMTGNSGSIPSSKPVNISLPTMSMTSAEAKQKLLNLSQSAEEAMTNLVWNSDSKLATMRVIYKNSQSMLTELMANEKILNDKFIEQINSLQSLYDKAIN